MSFQLPQPSDNSERAKKKGASVVAKETDPLIRASRSGGSLRARRSSKSPVDHAHFTPQGRTMIGVNTDDSYNGDQDGYESIESASLHRRQPLQQTVLQDDEESNYLYPPDSAGSVTSTRPDVPLQQAGGIQGVQSSESASVGSGSQPPLLEIPEEIYAVRKAALKVLKPLTKTWVRVVIGLLGGRTNGGHTDYAVLTYILLVPLLTHIPGCYIGWLCPHSALWHVKVDTALAGASVLVYTIPVLGIAYWSTVAACSISSCSLFLYCRSK